MGTRMPRPALGELAFEAARRGKVPLPCADGGEASRSRAAAVGQPRGEFAVPVAVTR